MFLKKHVKLHQKNRVKLSKIEKIAKEEQQEIFFFPKNIFYEIFD